MAIVTNFMYRDLRLFKRPALKEIGVIFNMKSCAIDLIHTSQLYHKYKILVNILGQIYLMLIKYILILQKYYIIKVNYQGKLNLTGETTFLKNTMIHASFSVWTLSSI